MKIKSAERDSNTSGPVYFWGKHPPKKKKQSTKKKLRRATVQLKQLRNSYRAIGSNHRKNLHSLGDAYRDDLYNNLGKVSVFIEKVRGNHDLEREIMKLTEHEGSDIIYRVVSFVTGNGVGSSNKKTWKYSRVLSYLDQKGISATNVSSELKSNGLEKLAREAARLDPRAKTKRPAASTIDTTFEGLRNDGPTSNVHDPAVTASLPEHSDGFSLFLSNKFCPKIIKLEAGTRVKIVAERNDDVNGPLLKVTGVTQLRSRQGWTE